MATVDVRTLQIGPTLGDLERFRGLVDDAQLALQEIEPAMVDNLGLWEGIGEWIQTLALSVTHGHPANAALSESEELRCRLGGADHNEILDRLEAISREYGGLGHG